MADYKAIVEFLTGRVSLPLTASDETCRELLSIYENIQGSTTSMVEPELEIMSTRLCKYVLTTPVPKDLYLSLDHNYKYNDIGIIDLMKSGTCTNTDQMASLLLDDKAVSEVDAVQIAQLYDFSKEISIYHLRDTGLLQRAIRIGLITDYDVLILYGPLGQLSITNHRWYTFCQAYRYIYHVDIYAGVTTALDQAEFNRIISLYRNNLVPDDRRSETTQVPIPQPRVVQLPKLPPVPFVPPPTSALSDIPPIPTPVIVSTNSVPMSIDSPAT